MGKLNLTIRTHERAGVVLRFWILVCFVFLCAAAWESGKSSAMTVKAASASAGKSSSGGKWVKKNGGLKYRYSDKTYAAAGFRKIGGYWYHFSKNGTVDTGWFTVGKYTYYGSKSTTAGKTGRLAVGWTTIGGKTYYFSMSEDSGRRGRRMTGWLVKGGNTYYLSKSGVVVTGLKKIDGKYFYFTKKGASGKLGKMITGWRTINGKKYYFRTTGGKGVKGSRCKSEWVTIGSESYYFNQDGTLNTETMLTSEQFISMVGKLASADMKESGILASVTTAQAILESGYGTSSLAIEAHNLFGMKASLSGNNWKTYWAGTTFTKETLEYLNGKWVTETCAFRKYSTYAQSITDHSNYLAYAMNGNKLRYKGVVGNKSYKKTIQIIKKGGYATDPDYVKKICALIKKYNLTQYDK